MVVSSILFELSERTIEILGSQGKTLALAESCTGGLISACLTEVPGSSAVLLVSYVTYANQIKRDCLDVPQEILEQYGAVSAETARAMADGARRISGADIAISVTGIAGPGGGSDAKPVGTVWIGYSDAEKTQIAQYMFSGGRTGIRMAACQEVLKQLCS